MSPQEPPQEPHQSNGLHASREPQGSRDSHEGGLGVADQIRRYRSAFVAVVSMIVLAAFVGGYILSHENLKLPSWVPVLGKSYFTLKGDFQTAQAVTPGQGQAVTIAGAKIGEIASVDLENGVATVTMHLVPKYSERRLYKNATMLLRPKTQLKDETVEVDPGTPASGELSSGATIPLSQTAPDANFDEFLAILDSESRAYLQELLAGLGEGLKNNGQPLSAAFKRFDPTARDLQEIASQLAVRHSEIAHSIHNFRLLLEAVGGKDKQLAELVDSANAVFKVFSEQDQSVQATLQLLPGALTKTRAGFGKLAVAANLVGPTLKELEPFAKATAPAEEAQRELALKTTPIFKNEIRPFARQILPVINQIGPATKELSESFPKLASTFTVLNELFNEFAYNPGSKQGGFLFFLDWANHDFNSAVSTADAHGPLGHTLAYFNCNVVPILKGVAEVNPTARLLLGLLNAPTGAECSSSASVKVASAARAGATTSSTGLLDGLTGGAFGQSQGRQQASTQPLATITEGGG
jgi:phospholipid/cholesterol/gamma-HCH transport system substrate-binding protein